MSKDGESRRRKSRLYGANGTNGTNGSDGSTKDRGIEPRSSRRSLRRHEERLNHEEQGCSESKARVKDCGFTKLRRDKRDYGANGSDGSTKDRGIEPRSSRRTRRRREEGWLGGRGDNAEGNSYDRRQRSELPNDYLLISVGHRGRRPRVTGRTAMRQDGRFEPRRTRRARRREVGIYSAKTSFRPSSTAAISLGDKEPTRSLRKVLFRVITCETLTTESRDRPDCFFLIKRFPGATDKSRFEVTTAATTV